ncbi:protein cereblon homolog [Pomacea canaliculata]|uniref:protein cereblon homolog n=1 Tax=Pomacea canaliculata TaxID=400727 RepID=UPI000D73597B|nr:protein cereblon homolog [Pomacea canaliculata]
MSAPWSCRASAMLASSIEMLYVVCLAQLLASTMCNTADHFEGFLLCRHCGLEVTRADSLVKIPSQLAHRQRNDTLAGAKGVLIQLFKNPQGKYFELITSSEADVQEVEQPHLADSWFPGFTWTIAVCPRCGYHLGWVFKPVSTSVMSDSMHRTNYMQQFIGLILGNLLHEQEAESIIAAPKTYLS